MLPRPEEVRVRVAAVFNAAAAHFDDEPLAFWSHFGRRTVELAGLEVGARVLDACCGSGASALEAAETVGGAGHVVGVDLADRLLDLARAKAAQRQLSNIEFLTGDLMDLQMADGSFDAAVCAFGIFFVPDMAAGLTELRRVVRVGGTVSITTWGERVFEPTNAIFWEEVGRERPDLRTASPPFARIGHEPGLRRLFAEAGLAEPSVVHETYAQPVNVDTFWTMVLGSGYRGVIDAMSGDSARRVRTAIAARLVEDDVHEAIAEVLYARAVKQDQ